VLRITNSEFSGAGDIASISLGCNGARISENDIQAPDIINSNCVFIDADAEKIHVSDNQMGSIHVYTAPAGTVGVRIEAGAEKITVVDNDFYAVDTDIVDAASPGETVVTPNNDW
jgi:hypothetical protein